MKLPELDFDGELPDGYTPLEALVVITGLDADGHELVIERATRGMTVYAAIGLLTTTSDLLRHTLLEGDDDAGA